MLGCLEQRVVREDFPSCSHSHRGRDTDRKTQRNPMAKTLLDELTERLRATQLELDREIDRLLAEKREQFRYTLKRGKVIFEIGIRRLQRQRRTGIWLYLRQAPLAYILSAPVTYGLIVPLLILDAAITVYQHVCFRIYGIPLVRRADYLVVDRHRLAYLNAIEKLNCVYCGYSNQLIEYAREVAGRTEQYWCPIKHARRTLDPHRRTHRFLDYGDAEAHDHRLDALRNDWKSTSKGA